MDEPETLVIENNIENNIGLEKQDEIICPECKENILIKIEDYKINLYDCKNKHNINTLFFKYIKYTIYK